MALEAVVFDWGGTLTPWHSFDPRDGWLAALADDDEREARADRLLAAELQVWARSRDEQRSGTLADVFAAADVRHTDEMLAAFSRWWEPHTHLDPQAPALFDALHERGLKIGVLSNTIWTRAEHERIFARDGVLESIDGAVYTSEIPWTKPHPEAFRAALDAVGVTDPAAAVFVGDRPFDDIHGAKSAGLHAVLIPHSDIPDVQKGPVEGEADAVIDELADL
ncbi:HAD family hydrolase, partial [Jatrophihabitans endophyticus]|uniref:HAD family hydrolase n=1 Tax=Jatrophihabitans endophyticus TaxID=1206085 RepID=UPI0019FE0898